MINLPVYRPPKWRYLLCSVFVISEFALSQNTTLAEIATVTAELPSNFLGINPYDGSTTETCGPGETFYKTSTYGGCCHTTITQRDCNYPQRCRDGTMFYLNGMEVEWYALIPRLFLKCEATGFEV